MFNLLKTQKTNPVKYKDIAFRLIAAVGSAFFIMIHGQKMDKAMAGPYFIPGFIVSIGIAIIVIEFVYWATIILDKYYPWENNEELRMVYQGLVCVAVPLLLSMWLASLWYNSRHISFWRTQHLVQYFWPEALGFVILSGIYHIRYHRILRRLNMHSVPGSAENKIDPAQQPAEQKSEWENICFLKKLDSYYLAYKDDGEQEVWDFSWEECVERLPSRFYFHAQNSCIIRHNNILDFDEDRSRRLIFLLKVPENEAITISQEKSKVIKALPKYREMLAQRKLNQKGSSQH